MRIVWLGLLEVPVLVHIGILFRPCEAGKCGGKKSRSRGANRGTASKSSKECSRRRHFEVIGDEESVQLGLSED